MLFKIARFIHRSVWTFFFLGTFLAILGAYYSVKIYKNLHTDIEELLPVDARSIRDLNEVVNRIESIQNMVVLVFSENISESKRFVIDLAKELQAVPKEIISSVEYRIDHELNFFKKRKALYIDLDDLVLIKNYIKNKISYEKELYNPINIFSEHEIQEPSLDYQALMQKYMSSLSSGYDHLPEGFYATSDEKVRAIAVYMPGKGLVPAEKMQKAVFEKVQYLKPTTYASDIRVQYTGNVQNLIEESAALVEDLELSTVIVLFLVSLIMIFFYRSFSATFILVSSLFVGTFWTFGLSYFLVGYLNANTAFLASIVIGNGVNFGVIFLARYLEERRQYKTHQQAVEQSVVHTASATGAAALAAGLSYGSLMLTGFRGFSQFGIIGFMGMLLCWLSAYTVLPAYLGVMDPFFGKHWMSNKGLFSSKISKNRFSDLLVRSIENNKTTLCLIAILGVFFSFYFFKNIGYGFIETDLSKLRDKRCIEKGSGSLYHYIDDIFQHSFSPTVILPRKREDSHEIAKRLKEEKKREQDSGRKTLISSIQMLDDFIPKDQEKKIKVLLEIKKLLPEKIKKLLPEKERKQVDELLNQEVLVPFYEKDLPYLVLSKFTEKDGSIGKIVLVDKVIQATDDSADLSRFVQLSRSTADAVSTYAPVVGDLPISFDLLAAITQDGPRATLFAFLAVFLLVILLFRDLKTISFVLGALFLGVFWLFGIVFGLKLKINFLNFIALPITFGIGVDYGVNILQRYKEEKNIFKVIQKTGGAVVLSSMTTIIGYGSLLIAGNQAFVSFGQLAVLGELTCVVVAVVFLPAFLSWIENKKMRL